jgi:hypothetical protein
MKMSERLIAIETKVRMIEKAMYVLIAMFAGHMGYEVII